VTTEYRSFRIEWSYVAEDAITRQSEVATRRGITKVENLDTESNEEGKAKELPKAFSLLTNPKKASVMNLLQFKLKWGIKVS
jgi:hypothetical protein